MNIGDKFIIDSKEVTIVDKRKGGKTKNPNYQSGALFVGFKNKPCTYTLSNGMRLKGSTIKKMIKS